MPVPGQDVPAIPVEEPKEDIIPPDDELEIEDEGEDEVEEDEDE